jgi:GMP synthase (glutamine-hydrolysing)
MEKRNIYYFQHVPFEELGSIEEWCKENGHNLSATRFYESASLPDLKKTDWLIIMGGPMSVNDEKKYPWLAAEKKLIRQAIAEDKTVIGICLGAQLIAESLGAKVYQNDQKEIGWFPIKLTSEAIQHKLFFNLQNPITVFHWHGDTFDIPGNAIHLATSKACKNQGFLYQNKILGLQFHLETTKESLHQMIINGRDELVNGQYIQTEKEIENTPEFFEENRKFLFSLLDRLAKKE